MARKFILENLVKLAQGIGANPSKFMGTKTNISFLGKGPTSNILFQNPVRIKNYLRNRGSDESVLGEINDAMGFATAGKLNPIQLEILNDNLIKIATIMKPSALPSLPSASVTNIAPKAFMGWTPKAVPKKASLVPTQESFLKQLDEKILQAEEGFLTRADLNNMSSEVLDNLRRSVDPIGMEKMFGEITKFASGGIASLAPRKRYARGSGRGRQDPMGGFAHQSAQEMREAAPDQFGGGMNISHGGGEGQNNNVISSPITNTGRTNYDFNLGDNALSPSFAFKYSPAKAANLRARIYNQNLSESDDINVDGSLSGTVGPVDYNTQFTDQGLGDTNLNYNNFSANIDPNKNYNIGYQTNRDGWNTGVNYDSDGRLMATIGTSFNKGGLARILEV